MKKIVISTHHFQIGGVEKSLIELLKYLPSSEYEVTIRCESLTGPMLQEIPKYCKIEKLPRPVLGLKEILKEAKKLNLKSTFMGLMYRIEQMLSRNKVNKLRVITKSQPYDNQLYDYAIAYDSPDSTQVIYTIENVKAKHKYCWIHFDINDKYNQAFNEDWYELLKKYDKLICVSKTAENSLITRYPGLSEKTCIIPNLIDYQYILQQAQELTEISKNHGETIICTVGRLSVSKGYLLAVEACKMLVSNGYNIKWLAIGEGRDRAIIESRIAELGLQDQFVLLGSQLNPYKYMNMADIYVQPSIREGQCITLLEARVLRKAIVCADFEAAHEQITDGYDGRIVSHNVNELFSAIRQLIDCPETIKMFSSNISVPNNSQSLKKLDELFSD